MEPRASSEEAFREWRTAVCRMAALGDGLPGFVRHRVWSHLADHELTKQHVDWNRALRIGFRSRSNQKDEDLESQIIKDLHRTGCVQFGSQEDKAALERVLLAYARWNKRVGYCQGFNVIAAGILDVMNRDEKEAFKIMVYLIDYVLPESYFAQNLQALSVDIAVFRHLLELRLPNLAVHLDRLQGKTSAPKAKFASDTPPTRDSTGSPAGQPQGPYEPPLMNVYIIQWFLTLFATCLAPDAVLRVWDSILLEGSEVLLRTAIVIMDFLASRLMKLKSADQFYGTMGSFMSDFAKGRIVSTREFLFEIYQMGPFPSPSLKEIRDKFTFNITPLVRTKLESGPTHHRSNLKSHTGESWARRRFRLSHMWRREQKQSFAFLKAAEKSEGPEETTTTSELATLNAELNRRASNLKCERSRGEDYEEDGKLSCETGILQNVITHRSLWPMDSDCNATPVPVNAKYEQEQPVPNKGFTDREIAHYTYRPKQGDVSSAKSLQTSTMSEPTDISVIGPGAVGEIGGPKPGDHVPSSHRARMSLTLSDLRSLYHQQLIRQHRASLHLPSLWERAHASSLTETRALSHTWITAVLPQTREIHQMSFTASLEPKLWMYMDTGYDHLDGGAHRKLSCADNKFSPSPVDLDCYNKNTTESLSSAESPESSPDFTHASKVDPALAGVVSRWQASAVWLCDPTSDTHTGSDPEHCIAIGDYSSPLTSVGQSPTRPQIYKTRSADLDSLTTLDTGIVARRPRSCEFAAKFAGGACSAVELSAAGRHTQRNPPTKSCTCPLRQSSARSCNHLRLTTPEVPLSTPTTQVDNACDTSTECTEHVNNEAHPTREVLALIPTHKSDPFPKHLPWHDASGAFLLRTRSNRQWRLAPHATDRLGSLGIPFPISPTRRAFGAQFGMYKTLHFTENKFPSTFCDRVQFVDFLRHKQVNHARVAI
ncbi:unnamed protein product [Dicrocoelium dendriticum]|nr:unnamed protein product [Dicrocoelium dendriticum]